MTIKSKLRTRKLPFILPLLLLVACNGSPEDEGVKPPTLYPPIQTKVANPPGGYSVNSVSGDTIQSIINHLGDTIRTGVPIPAQGQVIPLESVPRPVSTPVPAERQLNQFDAHPNVHPLPENLTVIRVDTNALNKVMIGKITPNDTSHYIINSTGDRVFTGIPIAAEGKLMSGKQPQPVKGLPMRMKDKANYTMHYLEHVNGEALSTVYKVLEDKSGHIWFGTYDGGVCKYDGHTFTYYTEEEGLSNNAVWSILEDKKGNLWFGTWGGGVNKYDGKSFTHYTEKEGLSNNTVWSILEDKKGNLWFGTYGGGVSKYDGKSFTHYTQKEGLGNNTVWSMLEDKHGNIWFGTSGGVTKYDGISFTNYTEKDGLSKPGVFSILEDTRGNIWFATNGGVSKFDYTGFTHFTENEGLSNNRVRSIIEDKYGNLWFGTYSGASKYNGKSFTNYTENDGLSDNVIWSIMEDRAGIIWFGSYNRGATRYNPKSFRYYTGIEGLSNYEVKAILEDKHGNLWFGTYGGGACKYDGIKFTFYTEENGLASNNIKSILEDKHGNLWFGTDRDGISKYDGISFTNYTKNQGLIHNDVWSIIEDKSGNVWFGTDGGLSKYDGKSFTNFTEKEGLNYNYVRCLLEDISGNIWVGTFGGGVSKYDGKNFTHYSEKEGLSSNIVWSVLEDKQGNLWFGTDEGGVNKYDGKRFTMYTEKAEPSISILQDNSNNIWFTSGNSLIHLVWLGSKDVLSHNTVNADTNLLRINTYERLDGLKPVPFSFNSVVLDSKNHAWWGTFKGVSMLDLNAFEMDTISPDIHLRELDINGQLVDYRNLSDNKYKDIRFDSVMLFENIPLNLELPYDKNHLTFHFSAIEWAAPHKIKYSYRMIGLQDNWSSPSAKGEAEYRGLPSGRYTFKVCAFGASNKWSEPFEYSFIIRPPWWKTWWAYAIYASLFLGALRTFSKWRERYLRAEKEKLEKIVLERTKELKSSQAQLIQSEKMASLGELTAGIAHEIQNPLNFVNNFSEVSNELIDEMNTELNKGAIDEAKAISFDLKQNLEKINQHGQRASSIVKGMLEHSRASSGEKTLTDINALCDEYLRLSYHGLRAKNKSFNSDFKTQLDPNLPKINVVSQDIARVILNIINNSFQACAERSLGAVNEKQQILNKRSDAVKNHISSDQESGTPNSKQGESGVRGNNEKYSPLVTISTKSMGDKITISISDNGPGIPDSIKDKIFQPFFTTKPTGQGTGLGLSLAYDIVKAHGGEIKVETKETEGTTFIITLPG